MPGRRPQLLALILCTFFFLAGYAFLPLLGIEADETLFVQGLFEPRAELYSIPIGHSHVPLMLMTYVGALKSWIYAPIFHVFGASIMTMRLPMLLAGVLGLWLFFRLLQRIAGNRAALIGCGLLAVDSIYLLTLCFDWGPVALQHLLLIAGSLLVLTFYQDHSDRALAGGAFLLGLALWDKALAVWMLSGIGIGLLLTFPRQLFGALRLRHVAIAGLAFTLGALPLVIYNAKNHWETFHGNFELETNSLRGKAEMLRQTATGGGLLGWLTEVNWKTEHPHDPAGAIQRSSAQISAIAHHPHDGLLFVAFLIALVVAPFAGLRNLRIVACCLITLGIAWIQMAINARTGGSVHHTILLWPLPELVIAVSFAGASRRLKTAGIPAAAAVTAVVILAGALNLNEYYISAVRFGGAQAWDDAVFGLASYLKTVPARWIYCLDWGILDQERLLGSGKLPLAMGSEEINRPSMSEDDRRIVNQMISSPDNLFITHTPKFEFFPGTSDKLVRFAAEAGFTREDVASISDTFGRPVFEIYRFRPAQP